MCASVSNRIMDGSVKLFQATRRFLDMGGIHTPQPNQIQLFNFKNLRILIGLVLAFFGVFGYFVFLAKNMFDYTISFYASVTVLFFISVFSIIICKTINIYKLLNFSERLMQKSKWNSKMIKLIKFNQINLCFLNIGIQHSTSKQTKYKRLIEIIEYICELFFLALMKISIPTIMGCALIVTMVNYLVFDLGDDAYYLPFPTMYIKRTLNKT